MSASNDGCGVGCELGCGFGIALVIVIALFGQCSARTISEGWHEGKAQTTKTPSEEGKDNDDEQ